MPAIQFWKINRQGFIGHWLVSGPVSGEVDTSDPSLPTDQFAREDALRAALAKRLRPAGVPDHIRADRPGRLNCAWRFVGGRDGAAILFANHPGTTGEAGDMRPGYWHGNGVCPMLKQNGDLLGAVYRIP